MPRKAILSAMFYVPLELVGDVKALRKELTLKVQPWAGRQMERAYVHSIEANDDTTIIKLYDLSKRGYIGVPRAFGLARFGGVSYVDKLAYGKRQKKKFRNGIHPQDEDQRDFMYAIANMCTEEQPVDMQANAKTGSGKTVVDLWLTGELAVPTLVLVPTNRLKKQWIERVEAFYGRLFVKKYVGIAQQDTCDFHGRLIVIGLMPSVARRNYGRDFYNHFGKVTIDEVHTVAAPLLSEVLKKLPAAIRIGYTATNRDDALKKVLLLHLGAPRIKSKQQVLRPLVHEINYHAIARMNDYNDRTLITSLTRLRSRNHAIANFIKEFVCDRRRICVALSDRTDQLFAIRLMLLERGVPDDKVGLFVGKYRTGRKRAILRIQGRLVVTFINRTSADVQRDIRNWSAKFRKALRLVDPEDVVVRFSEEEVSPSEEDYTRMAEECDVILATYGIFGTGMDVPRIDTGLEVSPRAKVVQPIGRILRTHKGKKAPIWYSIIDHIMPHAGADPIPLFLDYAEARQRSYREQNAKEIKSMGNIVGLEDSP